MRNRSWRRYKNYTKAIRKAKIIHEQGDYWNYKSLNQLNKGKIHCSCWLCSEKTKIRGYKISDLRKFDKLNFED